MVHCHLDYWPFSLFSRLNKPFLTTLHGRLDLPELAPVFRCFNSVPLVSISDAQRRPLAQVNFVKTIHHGIPEDLLTPQPVKQEYAAFLGRVSPEKGVDKAIRIAGKAGLKLKIAAKVDNADNKYYETEIRPLIQASPWVEFIGEINDSQKPGFLSGAHALLFPIDWPEPFGLAMIESMACGTPVIAFNCGSVPEVFEHGVTGPCWPEAAVDSVSGASGTRHDSSSCPYATALFIRRPTYLGLTWIKAMIGTAI